MSSLSSDPKNKAISSSPAFTEKNGETPSIEASKSSQYKQRSNSDWKPGSGATSDEWKKHKKISIDPFAEGRLPVDNFTTLITAIVPRPIALVSTVSKDGKRNIAPYSYFGVMNHQPPIFTLGFSGGHGQLKDTYKNIMETGELTISIVSNWMIDAANFTSTDSPYGVDEWKLSGLTPLESEVVKPPHVAESAFSVEAKLVHAHEWKSLPGSVKGTGELCIVQGVRFHAREDIINEELSELDISKLQLVGCLGSTSFFDVPDGYDIPRPHYKKEVEEVEEVRALLEDADIN